MSRLLDKLPAALVRGLITLLLALGLGMPLLLAAGQAFLLTRYALICAATAVCCVLLSLHKRAALAAGLAILASQAVLFALGRGFFQQTMQLMRALVLLIRDVPLAMTLYGDALCMQLAVVLSIFCFMLSSPDIDVSLPITIVAGMLAGEWMLGLRRESLYMLPVLPGLLLIYALTHSYNHTPETRSPRISPWAIPLAALLLALAWVIAPQEGVTSPRLAQAADDLREFINDRFFFQQQRARYTLANDGWMPLGERQLGGKPDPDERLVMYVNTADTAYLRGAILDAYTGSSWYDSLSARRYYWASPLNKARRDEIMQAAYPLGESLPEQPLSVQFASAGPSTLFVPQRIRSLETGAHMTPYFNQGSEVFITRSLQAGDSYAVTYLPMLATDSGMAALAEKLAAVSDTMYAAAQSAYTAVPDHIQQEIYDIAAAVTAGCETPWQKAVALRNYLRTNYTYTLDVQDPPRDIDFVAWFLLGERQGYCTYFASAMTMLCRIAGLPARYIEGYAANPDANGIAAVHGTNAHAWTEVYMNGLGWVTFDATPGWGGPDNSGSNVPPPAGQTPTPPPPAQEPTPSPTPTPTQQPTPSPAPQQATEDTPPPTPTPTPTPSPTPQPDDFQEPPAPETPRKHSLWWLWILLILAALALIALRIRVTEPGYRSAHVQDDRKVLLLLWQATLDCAALLKTPIRPDETPLSYALRAEQALGIPLAASADAISALRYGKHAPRRATLRAARETYAQLYKQLNPLQKARLAVKWALPKR